MADHESRSGLFDHRARSEGVAPIGVGTCPGDSVDVGPVADPSQDLATDEPRNVAVRVSRCQQL